MVIKKSEKLKAKPKDKLAQIKAEQLKAQKEAEQMLKEDTSVHGYYGVDDSKMRMFTKQALFGFLKGDKISDSLDECFPEMSAEEKCKVFAWASTFHKITDEGLL